MTSSGNADLTSPRKYLRSGLSVPVLYHWILVVAAVFLALISPVHFLNPGPLTYSSQMMKLSSLTGHAESIVTSMSQYRSNKKPKFEQSVETRGSSVSRWSITVIYHPMTRPSIQLFPTIVRMDMPLVSVLNTNSNKEDSINIVRWLEQTNVYALISGIWTKRSLIHNGWYYAALYLPTSFPTLTNEQGNECTGEIHSQYQYYNGSVCRYLCPYQMGTPTPNCGSANPSGPAARGSKADSLDGVVQGS